MRIISKFKDYWDAGMGLGHDPSLVFKRDQLRFGVRNSPAPPASLNAFVKIGESSPPPIQLIRPCAGVSSIYVGFGLLWVAGKLYPTAYMIVRLPGEVTSSASRFFYSFAELAKALLPYGFDPEAKKASRSWRNIYNLRPAPWFELDASEKLLDCAYEHRLATVSLFGDDVTINPRLADYEFFRRMGPFEAYQELSMFWGNLAAPERSVVAIPDRYRIAQHSFDEWSFRKPPQAAR